jgi:uncharacterized YigZ family protein
MQIKDTFNTIESNTEGFFKDKGSKFIAYAFPISSENEVKEHLHRIKKEHHSARHHCYAYRLGNEGDIYRANDDGEPSGTAGRPILGQLLSYELTNMLVVVVRYFGGTLLGVSGLINAYKKATIDLIENSKVIEKIIEHNYQLEFEYHLQNPIMRIIKDENIVIRKSKYEMNCQLEIAIRLNKKEELVSKLSKINGLKIKEQN